MRRSLSAFLQLCDHCAVAPRLLSSSVAPRLPGSFSSARQLHASTPVAQVKKKAPAGGAAAAPAVAESYDLKAQIPVNLLKEGPEPAYKPDGEYPPWLFKLLEDPPMAAELLMSGVENLSQQELKAVRRRANKDRLLNSNLISEKTKSSMD